MSSKDKKSGGGRPGIRTLADLNRHPSPGDGSDDSDAPQPQEYYTGGEKSGMLVQDPTKGNGPDIDGLFEQVRQMGARPGQYDQQNPSGSTSSSSSRIFTGTARTLSGETPPSAAAAAPAVPQPPQTVLHRIVFWNNGFTVDDGPLRMFDDPQNASFLESIKRSECPRELQPADRRTVVNVNLFRRPEDYLAPTGPPKPFQGVGRTLGEGSSSDIPPVAEPSSASFSTGSGLTGLSVDDSLPSTTIQLRLADGTRMVARFNTSHTVGHIRTFIEASRPGMATSYQLQTGFPPKVLSDTGLTIEQAGLANSVVIQKM